MLCFGFLTKYERPSSISCFLGSGADFLIRWHQMVGLRVVLGIFEAGFFPVSPALMIVSKGNHL